MSRKIRQDAEAIGSDSFLDVVTNTVGILIVLVMVVGIRAKNLPVLQPSEDADGKHRVAELADEAESLERDVVRLEQEIQAVTFAAQAKYQERGTLAYLLAEHQSELEEAKKTLGAENQSSFDVRRAVSAAEADLKKLGNAKAEIEKAKKKPPITIKSYPTPISHTVYGQEVHFLLRHGRLAWAPFNELADLCAQEAKSKLGRLQDVPELSDVLGPRQGFEARYYLERLDDAAQDGRAPVLFEFEMVPVSTELGETVEEAMKPSSQFRLKLSEYAPRQCTVTLWTYGDSFAEYAKIKDLLYSLGFQVAARPRTDDMTIGGSTRGSRSAAQ